MNKYILEVMPQEQSLTKISRLIDIYSTDQVPCIHFCFQLLTISARPNLEPFITNVKLPCILLVNKISSIILLPKNARVDPTRTIVFS